MRVPEMESILASVCDVSVRIPDCDPVKDIAETPMSLIAMESSAIDMRSPELKSMSISRFGGLPATSRASEIRSSVVSPIAETTTRTLLPAFFSLTMRSATFNILSGFPTEVPPYF
ncbi:MAG: hypothetical protein BWY32_03663 [bacterium ADurb.Bin243]|nr:MAG: hypothetical protein BWY32_03663 [bacterium ADurb.Bin243]